MRRVCRVDHTGTLRDRLDAAAKLFPSRNSNVDPTKGRGLSWQRGKSYQRMFKEVAEKLQKKEARFHPVQSRVLAGATALANARASDGGKHTRFSVDGIAKLMPIACVHGEGLITIHLEVELALGRRLLREDARPFPDGGSSIDAASILDLLVPDQGYPTRLVIIEAQGGLGKTSLLQAAEQRLSSDCLPMCPKTALGLFQSDCHCHSIHLRADSAAFNLQSMARSVGLPQIISEALADRAE